jgi:hypothetical protein
MKHFLIHVFLISSLSFLLACCQPAASKSNSNKPAETLTESLRNEPAVRSVETWENPYGEGLCVETRHYRLYTTLLEPLMLRQLPAFLESAYAAYQSQLPTPIAAARL